MKLKLKNKQGFTLIELLVVIAIISLLASIVFASLNSARKKARDAQRSLVVHQVQNALELYYNNNGGYPAVTDTVLDTALTSFLVPTYITKVPVDPLSPTNNFRYDNANQPSWYVIKIEYETKTSCTMVGGQAPAGPPTILFWGLQPC